MQLAERILRELTTAPLLTRQLAAKLDARTPGVMVACRCLRHKGLIHTENGLHALTRAGKNLRRTVDSSPVNARGAMPPAPGAPCGSAPGASCAWPTTSLWTA